MTKAYIVHYCDDKFPHQDSEKWDSIIEEIRIINPDRIIIFSSTECAVENIYEPFYDKVLPYLEETNKIVNVITPHLENTYIKNPRFVCERTYGNVMAAYPNFIASVNIPENWDFGSGAVPPYRENYQFSYLYSCYNVRVTESRVKMVDALTRENLIDRGMVTFHYPEKAVPLFTTNAMDDIPIPIYGDGMQMRDYQYVSDHCEGIDVVLHRGVAGEAYNVGTSVETRNIDMAHKILDLLGKPRSLITYVKDRAGHDRRYALDTDKLRALGWQSNHTFDQALEKTVKWYVDNPAWWRPIKSGEYRDYYHKQYVSRQD